MKGSKANLGNQARKWEGSSEMCVQVRTVDLSHENSGSTLFLDPEVINAASIQKAKIYQFEQQVPQFCFRKA